MMTRGEQIGVPINCHVYYGTHGPVTAQGVRAPQTIQQQKNKRMS
jgi:hypothetical protein